MSNEISAADHRSIFGDAIIRSGVPHELGACSLDMVITAFQKMHAELENRRADAASRQAFAAAIQKAIDTTPNLPADQQQALTAALRATIGGMLPDPTDVQVIKTAFVARVEFAPESPQGH